MSDEPRIVAAVGTAVGVQGETERTELALLLQDAMTKAVLQALADGVDINDSDEILRRKDAARLAVLDSYDG
jgi:hypothetical protein